MNLHSVAGRFALVVFLCLLSSTALAGEAMPWDGGLKKVADALTTTTAMYVCMIGFAFTCYQMIWGGEMSDFGRKIVMSIFVVTLIVGIGAFLRNVMGLQVTGALIGMG